MRLLILLLVSVLTGSVLTTAQSGFVQTPEVPPAVTAAVSRADEAMAELQTALAGALKTELGRGGPRAALVVCRGEAPTLAKSIGAAHQLEIGRTSHRVRNPSNAPRPWMLTYVASYAGTKAAEAVPATFDLGRGRIGVLRPIATTELCVTCHGPREIVEATIGDVLASSYPDDRAVGFAAGDLRGWFWAEVDLK